ncbi:Phenylalanine--tRNA ligase alpha subunit [Buchnera aphidicola (Pterocallis alni)]
MSNFDTIKYINKFRLELNKVNSIQELEILRIQYLGKKGFILSHIKKLPNLCIIDRKSIGQKINYLKCYIQDAINKKKIEFKNIYIKKKIVSEKLDISLPGKRNDIGSMHPINSMINYIKNFFHTLGFTIIINELEIENQYYNFDSLNIPVYHPSRNSQDTFWFDSNNLLRTQTSNMQIHEIKKHQLPIKIIVPGKVYRKDYDQTHSPMFHQIEGLVIDKHVNFSNLKWIINSFLYSFFGQNIQTRFRASYFPFTILSSEVDVMSNNNVWLEILGCGLVHPDILKRFNINHKIYSGLAFGVGVERLVMLYYGLKDLRLFYKNDLSFLKQFNRSRYF